MFTISFAYAGTIGQLETAHALEGYQLITDSQDVIAILEDLGFPPDYYETRTVSLYVLVGDGDYIDPIYMFFGTVPYLTHYLYEVHIQITLANGQTDTLHGGEDYLL
jgi:hypothetical protein